MKLLNKLSQRSQTAFRCTSTRFGAESNPGGTRAGKNGVTYRTGMRLPTQTPLQYSGATSKMQPPENSWLARRNRISLSHRNRCVSPSYSRGANRNGEGRWCSRRRNVSLGIRNERRACISGGVGGPQIAPDFQQRLTVDIGTGKVVARRARGATRS